MTNSESGIKTALAITPRDNKYLFSVLDTVLSSVVVAPVVIAYWRGTWYLTDILVFPENPEISLILSAVVGTFMQLVFALSQDILQKNFDPDKHRITFYVVSRLYTYVYGIACVNLWRGGYKALDFYSGTDVLQVVVITVVSLLALVAMKTMRNLSSAPFAVALDISKGYFQVPTMFKLTANSDTSLYVLDCFFSVFVIGSLVVFVWRGVWCLTDIFLYPDNEKYSAFGSLAIGYCVIVVIFSIQIPMETLCGKLTGVWRILAADIYIFISFIGTINLWRGFWNLLNIYFLPDFPVLSCWITHFGSFLFLVLINCSNSILVRGVFLDGEENKCVAFPISYLRLLFEEQIQKKMEKNSNNYKITSLSNLSEDIEKGPKENSENSKTQVQLNDSFPEIKS